MSRLVDADELSENICKAIEDAPLHVQATVLQYITESPTIDAVPVVHGQWNDIKSEVLNPGIAWVCRCSLCGCPQDYKHNYCPNCGAKMDGQVERDG